jgi:hypothetical protein
MRENKKRENKTRKPMHVFGLMLLQIPALVSVFYFLSYQARPMTSALLPTLTRDMAKIIFIRLGENSHFLS